MAATTYHWTCPWTGKPASGSLESYQQAMPRYRSNIVSRCRAAAVINPRARSFYAAKAAWLVAGRRS